MRRGRSGDGVEGSTSFVSSPLIERIEVERPDSKVNHAWHCAINAFANTQPSEHWPHFMYEAKSVSDEVPRMALLFARERRGELRKVHQQCSRSKPETVVDNHLSCCLGKRCSECPYLLGLEKAELTPEQIDEAKAWTCATHILVESGKRMIDTSEGMIMTEDDKMYWQNVYASMAAVDEG